MSLTERITALTTYANEVTGASDTTLSDAVATLASGYGSGGGGIDINDIATRSISGDITLDTATSIKSYAFANCSGITSISAPNVTLITGDYVFMNCTGLTEINDTMFPSLTNIYGNYTFQGSNNITRVFLPNVSLGSRVFRACTGIQTAVVKTLSGSDFYGDTSLTKVDIGDSGTTWESFVNCSSLTTIILRKSTITSCTTAGFNGTPFASGGTGGTIYVPSDLLDTYPSSGNWATLDGYGTVTWVAIEGSDYENYYADGTAIS